MSRGEVKAHYPRVTHRGAQWWVTRGSEANHITRARATLTHPTRIHLPIFSVTPHVLPPPDRLPLPSHSAVLPGGRLCGRCRAGDRALSGLVARACARADG